MSLRGRLQKFVEFLRDRKLKKEVMELQCSGTDAEASAVSSSHVNPSQSLLLSPPSLSSLGLASSSQSTPTVMSPQSSPEFSNSQSPTGTPVYQLSATSLPKSKPASTKSKLATAKTKLASASSIPVPLPVSFKGNNDKTWHYDPLVSPDWDSAGPPGILCSHRVKKDLRSIFSDPLPGIFIVPEEDNLFRVHCLIIGPFDTPYEGGFFHFLVRFGPQYPLHPPRVRLLTTGGGTVRFNPNLYRNGKVCLSILGTWSGPAWSPASNLSSVLLSLQSLMNEHPYHNEPGYEKEHKPGDIERYNILIMHETIRVAVIQQLQGITTAPTELVNVMRASFMEYYDHYVDICEKNVYREGTVMEDPFGEHRGNFMFSEMLQRLEILKATIEAKGIPSLPETPTAEPVRPVENGDDDASSISLSDSNDGALGSDEEEDENEVDEVPDGEGEE